MPVNGSSLGLLAMMKLPAAVVGGAGAIALVLTAFGFGLSTPGARLDEFVVDHGETHATINDTLAELDAHMHEQKELVEAIVRGECIENPVENLQLQGLISKCAELGIER